VSPTKTLNDLCVHNSSSGGEWNNTRCTSHRRYSPSYRNGTNQGLEAISSYLPILKACIPLKPKRPKLLLEYSTGGTIGHFLQAVNASEMVAKVRSSARSPGGLGFDLIRGDCAGAGCLLEMRSKDAHHTINPYFRPPKRQQPEDRGRGETQE
jgi:hypothetical protein